MKKSDCFIPKGALMVDINTMGCDRNIIYNQIKRGDITPKSNGLVFKEIARTNKIFKLGHKPVGKDFDPEVENGTLIQLQAFIVDEEFIYVHPSFTDAYVKKCKNLTNKK